MPFLCRDFVPGRGLVHFSAFRHRLTTNRRSKNGPVPVRVSLGSAVKLRIIRSIADLRAAAADWDRLWDASGLCSPLFRAEMIAQWLEQFAPTAPLACLAVVDGPRWLAALPLVGRRLWRLLAMGDLTTNCWAPTGELLLHPAADQPAVLRCLAEGFRQLPWPLLRLETVPIDEPAWKTLVAALAAQRIAHLVEPRYEIGQIELPRQVEDYTATWSRNHRQVLGKHLRHLQRTGPVTLRLLDALEPDEVDAWVDLVVRMEAQGWKGAVGGAMASTPGIPAFFRRQARQLAAWGSLRIALLELAGAPIAFEYGWEGKGVYYSFKIGYDERYATFSPGNILRLKMVQELCGRPATHLIDFHGPLIERLARWATRTYRIGRLWIAPTPMGRCLLAGRQRLRRWRGSTAPIALPPPMAPHPQPSAQT